MNSRRFIDASSGSFRQNTFLGSFRQNTALPFQPNASLAAEIASSRYALFAMTPLAFDHNISAVIASQRVRPSAGPMTGSAKQSRVLCSAQVRFAKRAASCFLHPFIEP
jgi:hypothetical protein